MRRFGRILARDIAAQLDGFRTFDRQYSELRELATGGDSLRFWRGLAESPSWAHYYLESFETLIARFAVMSGTAELISDLAKADYPADRIEAEMSAKLEDAEPPKDARLIPMMFALIGNLEAIARYSCTMSDLVDRLRTRGCVKSLARAAAIDVGVLALPASQFLMKFLELAGDSDGMDAFLRGVVRGPHRARAPYQELRWVEYLLREQKAFLTSSQDDIHDLIVNRLRIYGGDLEHKDSKKALFALFRKWRKELEN